MPVCSADGGQALGCVSLGGPGVEGSPRLPSGDREDGSHLCGVWTGRLWQVHPVGTCPVSHWLSRGPVEGRGVASSPEARALLQAGNDLEAPVLLGMSYRARYSGLKTAQGLGHPMGSLSFQSPFPRDQGHADVRPGWPSHLHTTQADLHAHHTVSRAQAHMHTDMLSHDSHTRTSTVCPWFSLRLFAQTLPGPQRQVSPRQLLPSAPSQVSGEQPQHPLASRPSPAAQGPQVSPHLREALGDGPG